MRSFSHLSGFRQEQSGFAMIWVVIIAFLVGASIAAASVAVGIRNQGLSDQRKLNRADTWIQTAANDISKRLDAFQIGPYIERENATSRDRVLCMFPGCPETPPTNESPVDVSGLGLALPITRSSGGRGFYQVLTPPLSGSTLPWRALQIRDQTRPNDQGSVEFLIRAWESSTEPRPVTALVTFRQQSLTRFSILTNEQLEVGPGITLGGRVHTNNSSDRGTGTNLNNSDLSDVSSVTTRSGSITGCSTTSKCSANTGEVFSFATAGQAFARAQNLAEARSQTLGRDSCLEDGFSVCWVRSKDGVLGAGGQINQGQPGSSGVPGESMPMWQVNITDRNMIDVRREAWALRSDIGNVAAPDDRVGQHHQNTSIGVGQFVPARGGSVVLFDGDVVVRGFRPRGAPPITIMAQRTNDFPSVTVHGVSVPARTPASIYLLQRVNASGFGSSDPLAPVGLVAEGGVYTPSYAMSYPNGQLFIRNVAVMAAADRFSYGPAIASIASDPRSPGFGLTPDAAAAAGYGRGYEFVFQGSIASAGSINLQYGSGSTIIGYPSRMVSYVTTLEWNPPPLFPSDRGWAVVKVTTND